MSRPNQRMWRRILMHISLQYPNDEWLKPETYTNYLDNERRDYLVKNER